MSEKIWIEHRGEGPLMATAIHAGHEVRGELLPLLALDDADRIREEDPYTDYWAKVVPTWIVDTHSRFEVDLNRPPEEAVYRSPEMAWGLHLWRRPPDDEVVKHSLEEYQAFYAELEDIINSLLKRYRRIVIFDLHAYNYKRQGRTGPPADPSENPEVNVGTGSMDRKACGHIVERFMADLRKFDFLGRHLDVRENVKFKGRQLAQWIHEHFPGRVCVISIEFKKFYMDEWTGVGDVEQIQAIRDALQSTIPGILEELEKNP